MREVREEEAPCPHGLAEGVVVLQMDGPGQRHEAAVEEHEQEERGEGLVQPLVG